MSAVTFENSRGRQLAVQGVGSLVKPLSGYRLAPYTCVLAEKQCRWCFLVEIRAFVYNDFCGALV